MAIMAFGKVNEQVMTRDEFSLSKARDVLKNEVISVLGYGLQGPAQAQNLRDNGFNVIVGQRQDSASWQKAIADGWVPQETLFSIEEAAKRGSFICYLLSDAGQIAMWPEVSPQLTRGKTLCFSHGFGVTYHEQTGIVPSLDIDVVLVAPKGSATSVRRLFLKGEGINSSYAVYQNASGDAIKKALAFGMGIGSGYLFETTFQHEVYSDLTGERGILMGALAGVFEAQYDTLRSHGHSPSEAFNETVEELTQSLIVLVGEKGMDWMYANTSTTAQRGALDWAPKFKKAVEPVFDELYEAVSSGREAKRVIEVNSHKDYREQLDQELKELSEREIWQAGKVVRSLRARYEK